MNTANFFDEQTNKVRIWLDETVSKDRNQLFEAMNYSLISQGKMIRPMLLMATCHALGGDVEKAIIPSGCIEMIHTYSLIHDDLPCMDNDSVRRGKPSNHIIYGETISLLAGDALLTQAFESLTSPDAIAVLGYELSSKLVFELASAAGASGMVYGQVLDIKSEQINEEYVLLMQSLKTGKLMMASCRMGALTAGANDENLTLITEYAKNLGILFQLTDDILDAVGDRDLVGKTLRKDESQGKVNIVTLKGVDFAKEMADFYAKQASDIVKSIDSDHLLRDIVEIMRTRNR